MLHKAPKIHGLSKTKILLALSTLATILLILMLCGVFSEHDDKTPKDEAVDSAKFNMEDSDASTKQLLSQIDSDIAKNKNKDKPQVAESSVEIAHAASDVPPIKANNSVVAPHDMNTQNMAKDNYAKKLQDNEYSSLGAKSLVYSNPLLSSKDSLKNQVDNTVEIKSGNNPNKGNASALKLSNNANADYLTSEIVKPKSPYEVKAGSVIPATMISGLNSDLPGQIVAQVRENVYDSSTRRYLLIPQGAKMIGMYDSHIAYGQERILVMWQRLIYPNGDSINLQSMPGTDLAGYAGLHDLVDNKYWKIFGTSFIMGVITGAMQYSQNNTNPSVQVGGLGVSTLNPNVGQTMAGSLGQQLGQTGLSVAQKGLNIQPTLIIRPNYPFNIMITADMVLEPYS